MEKESCDKEWVRQELILWEEGINARIAALRAEVVNLAERLERLEGLEPSYHRAG
jgi:uncharacterized protein YceH (UPF0502 family)